MIKQTTSLSDLFFLKADKLLSKSSLPLLKKDQVIDAKVLKLLSDSKAELLILGKKIVADTDTAIKLVKGDTLQLKATDQGSLNIIKIISNKSNTTATPQPETTGSKNISIATSQPETTSSKNIAAPTSQSETTSSKNIAAPILKNPYLLESSAFKLFIKEKPFEGFIKLVQNLFPDIKESIKDNKTLSNTKIEIQEEKNIHVENKEAKNIQDIKFLPKQKSEIQEGEVKKEEKIQDIKFQIDNKPAKPDNNAKLDNKIYEFDKPDDKSILTQTKINPETQTKINPETLKDINSKDNIKIMPNQKFDIKEEKLGEPKKLDIVEHKLQIDDGVKDNRNTIKNLFMSAALKSEKAEVDFIPKLLDKSGLLLEKKIKNTLQDNLSALAALSNSLLTDSSDFSEVSKNSTPADPILSDSSNQTRLLKINTSSFIQEDIKGAVLNFISKTTDSEILTSSMNVEDVSLFNEFINNLEDVQLLNSHLSESGKYLIPFPIFDGNQFSFGQLFFNLGTKDKDKENSGANKENSLLKVSIFLDMTNLGPIRADFSVLKNNITGGFQVSNEETALFFRQMFPQLKERLQIHEYNVHRIECKVVEEEKLSEKSIIKELLKSEEQGFSVMI